LSSTGKCLLEIGVGSGSFLASAQKAGFEVKGCDLSAAICERAKRAHGVSIHCGTISTLPGDSRFDIVVINHVLEHVSDPVVFLQDVRRLLASGGFVHIAVPNISCFERMLSGWTSYEPYHLMYFDKATLQLALKAADLEAVLVASHESFSGWFLTVLRTWLGVNRETGAVVRQKPVAATGTVFGKRSALVEHAYRAGMTFAGVGLWPLRRMQEVFGRGDELLCIARNLRDRPER
jgi:SAM-dependent methyltransferase